MTIANPGRLDPTDRVIMLSGANRGIGAAIAERLRQDGYRLSLGARAPESMAAQAGADCLCHPFDALDPESPRIWVEATFAKFGRIDGLINNAGISEAFGFGSGDEAKLDRMLEVNLKAPYRLIRAAVPHLKAAGSGRIINVTSLSGIRYKMGSPGYAMSKFAANGLSFAARAMFWDDGIRVTAVAPGPVDTDIITDLGPLKREDLTAPETVADVVAMVLALPNNASVATVPVNCLFDALP